MEFGERLKVLRNRKGLTQADVASKIGVSRRSYISYEQQSKRPRRREVYGKLAEVLDCDINDLLIEDGGSSSETAALATLADAGGIDWRMVSSAAGIASDLAAWWFAPIPLLLFTAIGGVANHLGDAKKERDHASLEASAAPVSHVRERVERIVKDHKSFVATSRGLIYSALAAKGTSFDPAQPVEDPIGTGPEEIISLNNPSMNSWWLVFEQAQFDESEDQQPEVHNLRASMLMSSFYDYAPDSKRKASIVVEERDLYDALLRTRGCNSYRGNLSAILVDKNNVTLAREGYIALYDGGDNYADMPHVAEELD